MTVRLYGIKNCDTVKKARAWLESHQIEYEFHDFKTQGVALGQLEHWCGQLGWESVLNRAGTTFRKLADADKVSLTPGRAIELMLAQPSLIKRPVLECGSRLAIGFKPEHYARELGVRASSGN